MFESNFSKALGFSSLAQNSIYQMLFVLMPKCNFENHNIYTVWPSLAPLVLDVRKSTLPLLYEPLRVIEESSYNDEDDRVIPINWEFLHVALGSRQLSSSLCCNPGQWVQFGGLRVLVHPDLGIPSLNKKQSNKNSGNWSGQEKFTSLRIYILNLFLLSDKQHQMQLPLY